MSFSSPALPGPRLFYDRDRIIHRAVNMLVFGLIVAGGVWWATRPYPGVPASVDRTFDEMARPWGIAGGFVLAMVGGLLLVWRWLRVRKILTEGRAIQAMVEDLESVKWRSGEDNATGKAQYRYSYYVTLRYTAQGAERQVRQKLATAGFTVGLVKGHETEVMVLDSAPCKPLIRAVYRPVGAGNPSGPKKGDSKPVRR
jgi:hypothetical protein